MAISISTPTTPTNKVNGSATNSWTPGSSFTAGRSCIIPVLWLDAVTLNSVTVGGVSAALLGSTVSIGSRNARLAFLANNANGGSLVVAANFSGSATSSVVSVQELFATGATVVSDAATNQGSGTGANPSISLTTNTNAAAIYALISASFISDPSPGAAYTLFDTFNLDGFDNAMYDLDAGTAGAKTVDWTMSAQEWCMVAAAFKEQAIVGTGQKALMANNQKLVLPDGRALVV